MLNLKNGDLNYFLSLFVAWRTFIQLFYIANDKQIFQTKNVVKTYENIYLQYYNTNEEENALLNLHLLTSIVTGITFCKVWNKWIWIKLKKKFAKTSGNQTVLLNLKYIIFQPLRNLRKNLSINLQPRILHEMHRYVRFLEFILTSTQ